MLIDDLRTALASSENLICSASDPMLQPGAISDACQELQVGLTSTDSFSAAILNSLSDLRHAIGDADVIIMPNIETASSQLMDWVLNDPVLSGRTWIFLISSDIEPQNAFPGASNADRFPSLLASAACGASA